MGGDNAPRALVHGAGKAMKELGVDITLVGRTEEIEKQIFPEIAGMDIVDAREVVTMDDDPSTVTRRKKDSSMSVALRLLSEGEGDAMVSAGSTGALLTGATLTVKRVHGIRRAALAPIMPSVGRGVMLIDCGANVECTSEYLLQFAFMGSFYMKRIMGCDSPRVGLLNNGIEPHKGGDLQRQAYALLEKAGQEKRINFIGNVEASEIFNGRVDVVVTDGFTGNIMLKGAEGTAKFAMRGLKDVFYSSTRNKLAAAVLKSDLMDFKATMDVNRVGGTALLGISKPVVKAHGSSNELAVFNAVRQAVSFAQEDVIGEIERNIAFMRLPVGSAGNTEV